MTYGRERMISLSGDAGYGLPESRGQAGPGEDELEVTVAEGTDSESDEGLADETDEGLAGETDEGLADDTDEGLDLSQVD